jgi:hypothetical protein
MAYHTHQENIMNTKNITKARELSPGEVALVSGGEVTQQGGGLPKPVIGKKPPEAPLPILTDLP